ncbi:MAG: endolytic transglycosylase MltG [Nocardiopsaceae bacterium]|nr:endolytic transglycosylase MltG [Nocardiopsaceae bacterium]
MRPAAGYPSNQHSSGYGGPGGYGAGGGGGYAEGDGWADEGDVVPGLGGHEQPGDYAGTGWPGGDDPDDPDDPRGRDKRGKRGNRRGAKSARTKKKRGPLRRLAPWIALLVILAPIVGGGLYGYNLYMGKFHPADYSGSGTAPAVTVVVRPGDTASSVAPELSRLGVVASSRAFVLAAEHSTSAEGLEPGTYKINRHMRATLAYAAILNPKNRVQVTLSIPEGQRAAQIVATLAKNMNVPVAEFNAILAEPSQLGLPSYARKYPKNQAEGFLWPATYNIQPKTKPLGVLRAMVGKFDQVTGEQNLAAAASRRGLSLYQLLIEASIVQAEGNRPDELPKIARVIVNRLDRNMPLQFDSVLEYGQNRFAVNIRSSWAKIPGPYNDFQHKGLPPTPICNPGMDAINAVLHPAAGNWLYFLAFPNGKSEFSATPLKGMS